MGNNVDPDCDERCDCAASRGVCVLAESAQRLRANLDKLGEDRRKSMDVEFERVSFDYGMTPDAVIFDRVARLAPDADIGKRGKYEMGLTPTDLVLLVKALDYFAYSDAPVSEKENAEGLRGSILETLNIEEI